MLRAGSAARAGLALSVIAAVCLPRMASALPYEINEDFRGVWNHALVYGAAWRASDPEKELVSFGNAKEFPGASGMSAVSDDPNLNYQKGDMITSRLQYNTEFELRYRGHYGVYAKASAWYDYAGKHRDVPHGSMLNGYLPDEPLDDDGYYDYNKFSGADFKDAYLFGLWELGDTRLGMRFGRQTVNWGESLLHLGLNAFNPVDFGLLGQPVVRQDQAAVPVNRIFTSLVTPAGLNVEAFYNLEWEKSRLGGCGSFVSGSDAQQDPGCEYGMATSPYSDREVYNDPLLKQWFRSPIGNRNPESSSGQFGLASRYYFETIDSELAAYYVNYHSVTPTVGIDVCPPSGLPLCAIFNGYGLQREWYEDVQAMALSATTGIRNVAFSAELNHFRNLPAARNFIAINRAASVGRGIYADRVVPGGYLDGAYKIDRSQLVLGFQWDLGNTPNISDMALVGETSMQWIHNLPDTSEERLGRNGLFGESADPDGSCPQPNPGLDPFYPLPPQFEGLLPAGMPPPVSGGVGLSSCDVDGFATDFSWGYRLLATATFPYPGLGVDLQPVMLWTHDVEGYSADGLQLEDRRVLALRLRGIFQRMFFVEAGRTFIGIGGDAKYDAFRDREVITLAAGVVF
jgi:hypothetical protein